MPKKEITDRYIRQGKCIDCGKKLQPIDNKKRRCRGCLARGNSRTKAILKKRKENHQCVAYGEQLEPKHPRKMCDYCTAKQNKITNAYNQKNAKHRKANNLCLLCGSPNKTTKMHCFDCNLRYEKYAKNKRLAKIKKKELLLDVYFPKHKGVVLNEFE